jgi:hypothetical protein
MLHKEKGWTLGCPPFLFVRGPLPALVVEGCVDLDVLQLTVEVVDEQRDVGTRGGGDTTWRVVGQVRIAPGLGVATCCPVVSGQARNQVAPGHQGLACC